MDRSNLPHTPLPKNKRVINKKTKANKKSQVKKHQQSTHRIQVTVAAMEKRQNEDIHLHHNHASKHQQETPQDKTSINNIYKQRKSLKNNYL